MKNEAIKFLKRKGLMDKQAKTFVIKFNNGDELTLEDLMDEFYTEHKHAKSPEFLRAAAEVQRELRHTPDLEQKILEDQVLHNMPVNSFAFSLGWLKCLEAIDMDREALLYESPHKENAKQILDHHGVDAQLGQLMEECLELALAIRKYRERGKSLKDVVSEVADVKLMLLQFHIAFPESSLKVIEESVLKCKKELNRIGAEPMGSKDHGRLEMRKLGKQKALLFLFRSDVKKYKGQLPEDPLLVRWFKDGCPPISPEVINQNLNELIQAYIKVTGIL